MHGYYLKYLREPQRTWRRTDPGHLAELIVKKTQVCEYCGLEFIKRGHYQKFCSKDCWRGMEAIRKKTRKPRATHTEEMQKWRLENPDKARALRHNYKARKMGNGGTYTGKELTELFEKQEGKCFYCGDLIYSSFDKELHVDHMVPLIKGGPNDITNIALACSKCNLSKHDKTAEEFLMEIQNAES